jgi:hypothetical protein
MGGNEGGWKRCGGVKMGCISTPIPNYLSTYQLHYYISLPLNHKTTHKRAGEREKEEECGNGADEKDG